jgi:predicted nucleic acid-binding protein
MRAVFADTNYLVALVAKDDQWHKLAIEASEKLDNAHVYTSDSVITEFLNFFCERGSHARELALDFYYALQEDPNFTILPQSRPVFNNAIQLYSTRSDKGYSMTDCISMAEMKHRNISEILTNDHHFEQESFVILMKKI